MERRTKLLIALVLALLLGGGGYTQHEDIERLLSEQQPGSYTVVSVEDGDTITVDMQGNHERVRMIGIDTPELHHPDKPVQCFAEAARDFVRSLIGTKRVRLEADILDDNRDIYQRLLRYIYLPDGTLVNGEIVRQGYGFVYTRFPYQKMSQFRHFQTEARQHVRGLWAGCQVNESGEVLETVPVNPS